MRTRITPNRGTFYAVYMIPFCGDEISTFPAGTDFTLIIKCGNQFSSREGGAGMMFWFSIKTHEVLTDLKMIKFYKDIFFTIFSQIGVIRVLKIQ